MRFVKFLWVVRAVWYDEARADAERRVAQVASGKRQCFSKSQYNMLAY
ncbi:protein of unknown function [Pararobbsia alpina]